VVSGLFFKQFKYMLVFIDESGIHKKIDHSAYALAYLEVNNYELLERRVCEIEKSLGIGYFHWSETVWAVKKKFMQEVFKLDFKLKLAVVKNPVHPKEELERVLRHLVVEKNILCIYIDGKQPKWYEREIKRILRSKNLPARKLKTVKSSQYAGVRLADMSAGLARSYFDGKNLERISPFYKLLEKKIIILVN
jgi:Protein of unknown function (DUF3800)